jgi:alpha-1,2-mannosyltransferase
MVLLLILLTPLLLGTVLWVLGYILIRILTLPETQRVCDDISSKCKTPLQTIAFFHPYCNAGGGGERVLWSAVQAIQRTYSNYHVVIYSGDVDATADAMLAKADASFGFAVDPARVTIAFLKTREYVEDKYYPRFTMLMQSMGSLVLTWEALRVHRPTILVDSMGYAFALPLFAMLAGSKVAAYVHYPTISTDMLRKVAEGQGDFNNDGTVARSTTLTTLKLVYYRLDSVSTAAVSITT